MSVKHENACIVAGVLAFLPPLYLTQGWYLIAMPYYALTCIPLLVSRRIKNALCGMKMPAFIALALLVSCAQSLLVAATPFVLLFFREGWQGIAAESTELLEHSLYTAKIQTASFFVATFCIMYLVRSLMLRERKSIYPPHKHFISGASRR